MNELDLMATEDILTYLVRNRFSRGAILSGIPNGNDTKNVQVSTYIKGKKPEVELIQQDIANRVLLHPETYNNGDEI